MAPTQTCRGKVLADVASVATRRVRQDMGEEDELAWARLGQATDEKW